MTDTGGVVTDAIEDVRLALADFLSANPSSSVVKSESADAVAMIVKPWGDASLALTIPANSELFVEALNNLVLPERLSALWHRDTRELEVIWTTRRLKDIWQEIVGRSFVFKFRENEHLCEFKGSSDRLLAIAATVEPQSTSDTGFRNMQSFAVFVGLQDEERNPAFDEPRSFWISNIDWDSEDTILLLQNLNFYITYFDNRSPFVIIHDVSDENSDVIEKTRYISDRFPSSIDASVIDRNLLTFWGAAPSTNQMMQFIIYYRMIEYCAMQYIDFTVKSELQRLISTPDIKDRLGEAVEKIVAIVGKKELDEIPRLKALVRNNVQPAHIWQDIEGNIAYFSEDVVFDGGFKLKAMVGATESQDSFCKRGLDQFTDQLRKIRNALSHGKDQETAGVILPTQRNMELLRPWVHLIATTAGDVALYKDVT